MTLDELLKRWYDTDPEFFDEDLLFTGRTLADRAWSTLIILMEDGAPIDSAFRGVYSEEDGDLLYSLLAPLYT